MLSEDEFKRIDTALGAVIERPGDFDSFQVDFAMVNADRLARYGRDTGFSERQRAAIARIEKRIAALDEDGD